jgi:hypothetical protein
MIQPDVPKQILVSGLDVLGPTHFATLTKQLGSMGLEVSVPDLAGTTTPGESVVSSSLDLEDPPELPSLADFAPDLGSEYVVTGHDDGSPRALISTQSVRRFSNVSGFGQTGSSISPFMNQAMLRIYGKRRWPQLDRERPYTDPEHLENDLWLSGRDGKPTSHPAILVGVESFLGLLHSHEEQRVYLRHYGPTTRGIAHYFMQAINLGPAEVGVAES